MLMTRSLGRNWAAGWANSSLASAEFCRQPAPEQNLLLAADRLLLLLRQLIATR